MKKYIILTIMMLFGFVITQAQTTKKQEYNRWAISAEFGSHMVASKTTSSTSSLPSFGGDIRYNVNDKLGIGLSGGYDNIDMEVDYEETSFGLTNTRFNFEAYINAFNMVDVYSDRFTFLFHGGPGISFLNASVESESIKQTVPNLRGGLTLLLKVAPRVALKGDISVIGNYTTDEFSGGDQTNSGVNSLISNASVGLSIGLGKYKKHLDDYKPEDVADTYIYNSDTTFIHNHYVTYSSIVNSMVDTLQYVFFDNDEDVIKNTELNAIFKSFINLVDNDEYTLTIKGLASPSEDETLPVDSDDYNMTLSENRANIVKQKFLDMGISESRITVEFYGKDNSLPNVNVHDAARRVELIVSTNK